MSIVLDKTIFFLFFFFYHEKQFFLLISSASRNICFHEEIRLTGRDSLVVKSYISHDIHTVLYEENEKMLFIKGELIHVHGRQLCQIVIISLLKRSLF